MLSMYCNFTKCQACPLAIRVSSRSPRCFIPLHTSKPQTFVLDSHPKLIYSYGFIKKKTHENFRLFGPATSSVYLYGESLRKGDAIAPRCFSSGVYLKCGIRNYRLAKARGFSSSLEVVDNSDGGGRVEKSLPWLPPMRKDKEAGRSVKLDATKMRSSWEESAEKFLKSGNSSGTESRENRRFDRRNDYRDRMKNYEEDELKSGNSFGTENRENQRFDRRNDYSNRRKSYEEDELKSGNLSSTENRENRRFDRRNDYRDRRKSYEEDQEGGEIEEGTDPRWDKIRNRFDRMADERPRFNDSPQSRAWSKQENWGKKTLKEASESRAPKIVGEGIYGVGPVLAALSAGRREFYALYTQEGLDLSGNNKKKKDKKGFEKVLRIADKLGVSRTETSKHDLNMFTDNRPHQGLVLDASPLEMVNIRELDRVLSDGEAAPLWVALDEVTDPQNLGAIIRSAYFFGVSGVVLCAKNSAPLSGVVSKASAGALELTELRSCKNMMQFLVSSAENGWRVLGGSVSLKAVPLNEIGTGEPTILVLGSEGTGLRPLVERSCTELIRISGNIPVNVSAGFEDAETAEMDQRGSGEEFQSFMAVESLNVSVAAGVLLHHLVGSNKSNTSQ